MRWSRKRRRLPVFTEASAAAPPRLTAAERGNVTDAHRNLLNRLTPSPDADWSTRALWACLEELRHSITTEAAEVRVFEAWPDGPAAFCVVYSPPFQPDERVGLRRQQDDPDVPVSYGLSSALFQAHGGDQVDKHGPADPIAFGVAVAAFDTGEPLGNYYDSLQRDAVGVGWWGSFDGNTPLPSH